MHAHSKASTGAELVEAVKSLEETKERGKQIKMSAEKQKENNSD
jgi:hypothetical protein